MDIVVKMLASSHAVRSSIEKSSSFQPLSALCVAAQGVTLWLLLLFAALAAAEVAGEVAQEDAPEACEGGSEEAKGRVSTIRHASSVIAGFADGALAQVPGGTTVVPVIQAGRKGVGPMFVACESFFDAFLVLDPSMFDRFSMFFLSFGWFWR